MTTRAAIYTRVSSEMQLDGHSLDAQMAACRAFCVARGYVIAGEYTDPAESASSTHRPQFQRMMSDMRAGAFSVIVAHKLDRLSRNVTDVLATMRDLQQHGAMFASVTEQFDFTTPIGRVILAVLAALAEWFLDNLRAEIGKGKHARAAKGMSNASIPPFGYSRVEGVMAPNEHAQHVRWAFGVYASGQMSYADIAGEFNRRGLVTPRGGPFNIDNVREIIQNPWYAGWVRERGVMAQYTASGARRRVPRDKGTLHAGTHEPIVDQATWNACLAVRQARHPNERDARSRHPDRYLFAGIAHCARCGRKLTARSWVDGRYPGYMCISGRLNLPCESRAKSIMQHVLAGQAEAMMERITLPGEIERRAVELANGDQASADYERRRRALVAERGRLNTMYQKGFLEESRWESEMARVGRELDALQAPADVPEAVAQLHRLAELWRAASDGEKAMILRALFERVEIDLDRKIITRWVARDDFAGLIPDRVE